MPSETNEPREQVESCFHCGLPAEAPAIAQHMLPDRNESTCFCASSALNFCSPIPKAFGSRCATGGKGKSDPGALSGVGVHPCGREFAASLLPTRS